MKRRIGVIIYNKKTLTYYLLLIVIGAIFMFLMGEKGPLLFRDSPVFIDSDSFVISRYYFYIVFLDIMECLFGRERMLFSAYIIQSLIGILSCIILAGIIKQEYHVRRIVHFGIYVLLYLPFFYSMPENMVNHHILTEALAIPFFYIFFGFVLMYINRKDYCSMVLSFLFSGILLFTRRPLGISVVFMIVIVVYENVLKKLSMAKKAACALAILAVASGLFISVIIAMETGNFHTQMGVGMSGRALACANQNDAKKIDAPYNHIFMHVYDNMEKYDYIIKDQREYYAESLSAIYKINEITKKASKWIGEYCADRQMDMGEDTYNTMIRIAGNIIWHNPLKYILSSLGLSVYSFVAAIFIQPEQFRTICYCITAVLYILFFVIYGCLCVLDKDTKARSIAGLTMTFLVMNVLATSFVMYGQQRYVIYTFGLFYVSILIMLDRIYVLLSQHRGSSNAF